VSAAGTGLGLELGFEAVHPLMKIIALAMTIFTGFIPAPWYHDLHDYRSGIGFTHPSMEGFRF
jgi:hypothetical protein